MKAKFFTGIFMVLLLSGMALAQPADQAPENNQPSIDVPTVPGSNSTAPSQGISGGGVGNALDFLPSQASDTARSVLNTIVDTPSAQIGEALQSLLGNQPENTTAQ